MRDKLVEYVNLLFAGADAEEIRQEILQNTLDRYDDLVAQGKSPEAAYRLAISGIGDISEILGSAPAEADPIPAPAKSSEPEYRDIPAWKKILRAVAVGLYIISIIPLIVLSEMGMDVIGLCGTLSIIAVATVAIIGSGGKEKAPKQDESQPLTPQQELRQAIRKAISTVGLVLYIVISFTTGAWHITWLVFPIIAAVNGIVRACLDLKEAAEYEN